MVDRTVAAYGAWRSAIRVDDVVSDVILLGEPWVDGDEVYWLEGRPSEGGRRVLVQAAADGSTADLTPPPFNVRTRVHEYGGGSYIVTGGVVVFSNFADGRLYRLAPGADTPVPITPQGPWRYADLRPDPARRRYYAVREDHAGDGQPVNSIVAIPFDDGDPSVLVRGADFVAGPRLSPDGSRLCWLEWDHPDMPWDSTVLRVAAFEPDGTLGPATLVAGGPDESIVQPEWGPDGTLHLASDRTGWWNLYRLAEGPRLEPLGAMDAEFADPPWIFDRSSYGFLPDGAIVAIARAAGRDHLYRLEPGKFLGELDIPFTELDGLRIGPRTIVALAGSPGDPSVIARFDLQTLAPSGILRRVSTLTLDAAAISHPESIEFPTTAGETAHALYYAPANPDFAGPDGEKPPLIVLSHGGPTSNASTTLDLAKQFMTSRGIAIVDVDYGGSTGYGRAYRQRLEGQWGVVDVDDCIAAAEFLVERGDVDPERLVIEGGSAGGYTTLAALAFRDVFAAGISHFGVGDLEALEADTHKFESRYSHRLVGPYPETAELYRERSPTNFPEAFSSPVLILQGLEDRVVPPAQAEAIVASLADKGIPYAYLAFEGEGHGFRGAYAVRRTLEARLSFLGQLFGFKPADAIKPLDMPGLEAWRASHPRRRPLPVVPAGAVAAAEEPGTA
jgi:dipeptidyl aminopeptidase/acylaminoacyl peptidase